MIFSEQDLRIGSNAFDIINESAWIDGSSIISPRTIALVESSSIGGYVVRFNDVEALSEEYGIDYIDSMLAIAEVNGIDPQYLAVAVNESDIIINPDLIYELANVITVPISESSTAYQFCEACIDGYAYTGDERYIDILVEGSILKRVKKNIKKNKEKRPEVFITQLSDDNDTPESGYETMDVSSLPNPNINNTHPPDTKPPVTKQPDTKPPVTKQPDTKPPVTKQPDTKPPVTKQPSNSDGSSGAQPPANNKAAEEAPEKLANAGATETAKKVDGKNEQTGKKDEGIINKIKRTVGSAVHKSADWIARKIASLRLLYSKWMEKARIAKAQEKASWFQTIGEKVLNAIDWALSKLQGFLKSSDESRKEYEMDAWDSKLRRHEKHQNYDEWKKSTYDKHPNMFKKVKY